MSSKSTGCSTTASAASAAGRIGPSPKGSRGAGRGRSASRPRSARCRASHQRPVGRRFQGRGGGRRHGPGCSAAECGTLGPTRTCKAMDEANCQRLASTEGCRMQVMVFSPWARFTGIWSTRQLSMSGPRGRALCRVPGGARWRAGRTDRPGRARPRAAATGRRSSSALATNAWPRASSPTCQHSAGPAGPRRNSRTHAPRCRRRRSAQPQRPGRVRGGPGP